MTKKSQYDPFFSVGSDSNWNACIGIQGDEESYADGFIQAAVELIDALFEKEMFGKRDTLVFPILYNARHGIELALKIAIGELVDMGVLKHEHRKNHDILAHWGQLQEANLGDESLRQLVSELEPFVTSLSQIDEDGQELRYHENRDGKQSLDGHAVTSLLVIRVGLTKLAEILKGLKIRLYELREERFTGSFTKDCSRRDLMEIARILPPFTNWKSDAFDEEKQTICERYGLSGNQFSNALNLIKTNREAKLILGEESQLLYIADEQVSFLVEKFYILNPRRDDGREPSVTRATGLDVARVLSKRDETALLYPEILNELSVEVIADVRVIFYLGRNDEFPETYEERVELEAGRLGLTGNADGEFIHVFSKLNFVRELEKGLRRLGRSSLANVISEIGKNIP